MGDPVAVVCTAQLVFLFEVSSLSVGYEPMATPLPPAATAVPVWQDRTIASTKLRMLEYSAFMEVQRDPDTVPTPRNTFDEI